MHGGLAVSRRLEWHGWPGIVPLGIARRYHGLHAVPRTARAQSHEIPDREGARYIREETGTVHERAIPAQHVFDPPLTFSTHEARVPAGYHFRSLPRHWQPCRRLATDIDLRDAEGDELAIELVSKLEERHHALSYAR